jgi:hypothetical protein
MLFVFDVAGVNNPNYPWANTVGCGLGIVPGSPGLIPLTAVAGPAGTAILPLPLTGPTLPLGTSLYLQSATLCGGDLVFGLVLTPFHTVYVASV